MSLLKVPCPRAYWTLPLLLPVPKPRRLSLRPVLPRATWSTAVRLTAASAWSHEQEVSSSALAAAPERSRNWRRFSWLVFILFSAGRGFNGQLHHALASLS